MLCIFCGEERPPSLEHVFPLAIGGTVTTDRVCRECNSALGTRVDAALSDFFPIRMRRAKLNLAGNKGVAPAWYEMFLGKAKVIGQTADRVRRTFNNATGQLETRQLYHAANVEMPDGRKVRQITVDSRDKDQIPTIINRERKRHGMPTLSDEELAAAASAYTTNVVKNPVLQISPEISFAYLRHAMFKIAYELAFLWLGESYLDDPLAKALNSAIRDSDIASTDKLAGYIGALNHNTDAFSKFWLPHENHHLAYASVLGAQAVAICIRIFDIYTATVAVSNEPSRYIRDISDRDKLRFLAIDATTGKTIDTTFNEESLRIRAAMRTYRRFPPFPDPLTSLSA
jgi:hypothetical protein